MLLKLLKYELKSNYLKFLGIFLIYTLLIAILLIFFRSHSEMNIAIIIVAIITLCVIACIIIFQRYNSNLYGNEGYLMFTLPVNGSCLLMSKFIAALIWSTAVTILIVPTVILLLLCYDNSDSIGRMVNFINADLGYAVIYVLESILGGILSVLSIYFSISVSKLALWRKFGVLMGFVTYGVVNFICSIPTILANKSMTVSKETNSLILAISSYSSQTLLVQFIANLAILIALFFATAYLLEKRTSLK